MTLDKQLGELPLSGNTTPDGKGIITLEDYLALYLTHPKNAQETLRLNCSSILKLLDVSPAGQHETKRAATWLRANGFRASGDHKIWKVALVDAHVCHYRVI